MGALHFQGILEIYEIIVLRKLNIFYSYYIILVDL